MELTQPTHQYALNARPTVQVVWMPLQNVSAVRPLISSTILVQQPRALNLVLLATLEMTPESLMYASLAIPAALLAL